MPLDLSKLDKLRAVGHGFTARCPACAETGNDKAGQHLKVDAEGRFCCVVNPGREGKWHRKRIFQLAGNVEKKRIEVVWRMAKV